MASGVASSSVAFQTEVICGTSSFQSVAAEAALGLCSVSSSFEGFKAVGSTPHSDQVLEEAQTLAGMAVAVGRSYCFVHLLLATALSS